MPAKSTLTQRRSLGSATEGATISSSSSMGAASPLSSIDTMSEEGSSKGSAVKILIWVAIILVTGIGLAFLIRGLTADNKEPEEEQEETTPPPSEEPEEEEEEPIEEPEEEEETPTEEEPTEEEEETPPPATGDGLTNEYSMTNQTLGEGLTTNTVNITGYTYSGFAANFVYTVKMTNSDTFPTVTAALDQTEKTLTVVVSNVRSDGIVGNGGSGSTDFAAPRNVTSVDITNASNKTTFVFNLNKATQYKIYADGGNLKIDIKNS